MCMRILELFMDAVEDLPVRALYIEDVSNEKVCFM